MYKTLQNKPRVFLSHSKKDTEFIHKLCKDFRLCQIEPWLDSQEIRHGQPWLDAIFESGIPTCDAVLVYLTESSIESPMVKKEIDASIINKLKDSHVAFLPYVSQDILRDQLRVDIQSLQTPEWNKQNYAEMLPRVVAEIWHTYLDRVVSSVTNQEKVRRLEAENELEKLKKTGIEGIFDAREAADFEFIWRQFDRHDLIELSCYIRDNKSRLQIEMTHFEFRVHLQTIIPQLDKIDDLYYPYSHFTKLLRSTLASALPTAEKEKNVETKWLHLYDFINDLQMYGLIKKEQKIDADNALRTSNNCIVLTDKLYRFKYWLAHKGILPNEIKWEKCN